MSFIKDLNPEQKAAVQELNGPVLVIAGAGSGKTRVLTYRIAHLLRSGVPAYQILALTFTNKAAGEMRQRAEKLVTNAIRDLWIGTFHSLFARILRTESRHLEMGKDFAIYDADDSLSTVKRCFELEKLSHTEYEPRSFYRKISYAKNSLRMSEDFQRLALTRSDHAFASVYTRYEKQLRLNNAMDFDDLIVRLIELFRKRPDVLHKYQDRFRFLLVDEFQDTNRAQYLVCQMLAAKFKNICVVGDDAQSIYSFRGAEIKNILDFKKDFKGCKLFRLEQNYRSTRNILSAADSLIKHNSARLEKTLWTDNPAGDSVTILSFADDKAEAIRAVQLLQDDIRKRHLQLKDAAILYRTNAQSRSFEDQLRRTGLPYVIVGGIRFYERKEIKDLLAYLRLLVNPNDDTACLRVINTPSRGIGETTIAKLKALAENQGQSLFLLLDKISVLEGLQERSKKAIQSFAQLIRKYKGLIDKLSPEELLRSLVDELGIIRTLREDGSPESFDRIGNIEELYSSLADYISENPDGTIQTYLETVTLVNDIDVWDDTKNVITLMTLHSSKGLEFPIIFIAGVEEGILPLIQGNGSADDNIEEERRLCYVGMTRAKDKLYLSRCSSRYRYGTHQLQVESRFIGEMGTVGVERTGYQSQFHNVGSIQKPFHSSVYRKKTKDEHRQTHPAYEEQSQIADGFIPGMLVSHETFGRGSILEINGSGDNARVTVRFESVGIKRLILKYANLKTVDPDFH